MGINKSLECSSKGDKRFSAMYAKVEAFGVIDTIEHHYQKSKRDASGQPVKKGQPVDHMVLNRRKYPAEMLTDWYRLLWVKYLDQNPELVEYARQFEEFTDMFRTKNTINCQADVIRDYVLNREQLIRSADGLSKALRKTNERIEKLKQAVSELINAFENGSLRLEDLDENLVLRLQTHFITTRRYYND